MAALELEQEEKDLLDSYERGEWKSVKNLKQELQKHKEHARETLKKDKRVNIRVSSMVLDGLQARAAEDGIPYQTLISSILHRFVAGRLIEKPRVNEPREDSV
jgi:predicted DNA binding CopG/RHH family protein